MPCSRGLIPAAAVGDRYFDAAMMTGGHEFSICTSDWSGLFTTLGMTVARSMALPCTFEIPEPPAGMTFDRSLVNVVHTPDGGSATTFPRAESATDCAGGVAWHYDDPDAPTRILLCTAACDAVTGGPGSVEVQLGCETVLF